MRTEELMTVKDSPELLATARGMARVVADPEATIDEVLAALDVLVEIGCPCPPVDFENEGWQAAEELEVENERLREALVPFAEYVAGFDKGLPDSWPLCLDPSPVIRLSGHPNLGDCRTALRVLDGDPANSHQSAKSPLGAKGPDLSHPTTEE